MEITSVINEAVKSISELDGKRRLLSEKLLPLTKLNLLESGSPELAEEKLIIPVEKASLNCKIAGVDSGFVDKDLFALDLVLIRAMGAVFNYKKEKLAKAEYFPSFYSFPEPSLSKAGLEADEFQCSKSIDMITSLRVGEALIVGEATHYPLFFKVRERKSAESRHEKSLENAGLEFEQGLEEKNAETAELL